MAGLVLGQPPVQEGDGRPSSGRRFTGYLYNRVGRLRSVRTAATLDAGKVSNLASTEYGYDPAGNKMFETERGFPSYYDDKNEVVDAKLTPGKLYPSEDGWERASSTVFGYDVLGRVVSVKDPFENTSRTRYDAADRVVATQDREGQFRYVVHDRLDRPTHEFWVTSKGSIENFIYNKYDWADHVTVSGDAAGSGVGLGSASNASSLQALEIDLNDIRFANPENLIYSNVGWTKNVFDPFGRLATSKTAAAGLTTYMWRPKLWSQSLPNCRGMDLAA